nr:hypothetical protein [Pandoravirus belohorizontensis]
MRRPHSETNGKEVARKNKSAPHRFDSKASANQKKRRQKKAERTRDRRRPLQFLSQSMSQTTVLAGLPVELWGLVVCRCADTDVPRLSATCVALRVHALARLERRWAATRNSVDTFVSRWQDETAQYDRWRLRCTICPHGTSRPPLWTFCLPPFLPSLFLCVRICILAR